MGPSTSSEAELLAAFRRRVDEVIEQRLDDEARASALLRSSLITTLGPEIERARADGFCGRVWLFGSFAWGNPGERSDVDLLVEGDESELGWRISRVCGRELHIIPLESAPPSLRSRVLADGIPL